MAHGRESNVQAAASRKDTSLGAPCAALPQIQGIKDDKSQLSLFQFGHGGKSDMGYHGVNLDTNKNIMAPSRGKKTSSR